MIQETYQSRQITSSVTRTGTLKYFLNKCSTLNTLLILKMLTNKFETFNFITITLKTETLNLEIKILKHFNDFIL